MIHEIYDLTRLALAYGRVERGVNHPDGKPETDTDHSVSLAWLACSLAQKFYPELDKGKIAQFAIVHDAVEVYAGDTYAVTAGDEGRRFQAEREHEAYEQIRDQFTVLPWLPEMIAEYERFDCPEANFVRAVDKMMPEIVLRIEGCPGKTLRSKGVTPEMIHEFREYKQAQMNGYAKDFPELLKLREELYALLTLEDEMAV